MAGASSALTMSPEVRLAPQAQEGRHLIVNREAVTAKQGAALEPAGLLAEKEEHPAQPKGRMQPLPTMVAHHFCGDLRHP